MMLSLIVIVSTWRSLWSIFLSHQGCDTLSWTALDLLTSGSGCLSRLCSVGAAAWPQTLLLGQEVALLRSVLVLRNYSNLCKKAPSPVLHRHRVRGEGGLTTKQSGGRNRHIRGLVATSFMRRSGAVNTSVIEFIRANIFTTHCQPNEEPAISWFTLVFWLFGFMYLG